MSNSTANPQAMGDTGITAPALLLLVRMIFVATIACSIMLGVQCVFYGAVMRVLKRGDNITQRVSLMVVATALMILNIIYCLTAAVSAEQIYIENAGYPGGFAAYLSLPTSSYSVNVTSLAAYVLESVIADGLLLWRTYVIFRAVGTVQSQLLILPAGAVYLASIAVSIPFQLNSASPTGQLYGSSTAQYGTIFFACSFVLNFFLTFLITVRIWLYQRHGRLLLGSEFGKAYTTLYTIFVESAVLSSVVTIGVFVTFAIDSPTNQFWIGIGPFVQSIASYLIVYRSAQGRSWERRVTTNHVSGAIMFKPGSSGRTFSSGVVGDSKMTGDTFSSVDTPLHVLKTVSKSTHTDVEYSGSV